MEIFVEFQDRILWSRKSGKDISGPSPIEARDLEILKSRVVTDASKNSLPKAASFLHRIQR